MTRRKVKADLDVFLRPPTYKELLKDLHASEHENGRLRAGVFVLALLLVLASGLLVISIRRTFRALDKIDTMQLWQDTRKAEAGSAIGAYSPRVSGLRTLDGGTADHPKLTRRRSAAATSKPSRPLRILSPVPMEVTAYTAGEESCGEWADGITASGLPVDHNGGQFVAADTGILPFGSIVRVPGYAGGGPVPVIDRGGAIRNASLDVFFEDLETALEWGRKSLDVVIVRRGPALPEGGRN